MRCFFLAIHVTKRHFILYMDVEFTVKFLIVTASLIGAAPLNFQKNFNSSFLIGKPPIEAAGRLLRFA